MGIYRRGIPTAPDIETLRTRFDNLPFGTVILYSDIEKALNLKRASCRFNTVVFQWRRKLDRERNIILRAVPSVGLEVLDGHGRVDMAGRGCAGGIRKIVKASNIVARTDRSGLSQEENKVCDHLMRVASVHTLAHATASKGIDFLIALNPNKTLPTGGTE